MVKGQAYAHGRVNLIGEHTDYNGGWVLPTAIPQRTRVTVETSGEGSAEVILRAAPERAGAAAREARYTLGEEAADGTWADYLKGATKLLREKGARLEGFRAEITSDVPEGSGLSSSAALEVAFLKALREAFSLTLTDEEIALLGQRIENEFVGARVGIMDQMACAFGRAGEALFLDTATMDHRQIPLPLDRADLVVISSGVRHRNSDGGYNARRADCEAAARELGAASLRDLHEVSVERLAALPDRLRRRARHVITENHRVLAAVRALEAGDLVLLGKLFYESHRSMRDDYNVSVPEIDLLVELLSAEPEVFGARLTGGGFGGSVVALTAKGSGRKVADKVMAAYASRVAPEIAADARVLVPGGNA